MGKIVLVVEEQGPSETYSGFQRRIIQFLKQKITVWVLHSEDQAVTIFRPDTHLYFAEGDEELKCAELETTPFRARDFFPPPQRSES